MRARLTTCILLGVMAMGIGVSSHPFRVSSVVGHLFADVVRNILSGQYSGFAGPRSLYAVGGRSLFHTLRNAPSVMGRAPAKRKTTSPTTRSHSSLW